MKTYYFTLTGTKHHYGNDFIEKDMIITLEKEPDNEYDKEAIKVCLKPFGCIGYVANSPYTVIGDDCYQQDDYMIRSQIQQKQLYSLN